MGELLSTVMSYAGKAADYIKSNLGTIAVGAGGVALGAGIGAAAATKISSSAGSSNSVSKSRKYKSRTSKKRKSRNHTRRRRKGRYTPHTAGKGRDTSHKRIRYTKNGQPYIILGSGKAKFIKKHGARSAHKRA